jgi:GntR family transcriptional repressor for pyruvate dehydrogenase complex
LDDLVTRRHELVVAEVLDRIVARDIASGDWLPREVDFADEHGISRGVAREAIQALKERGLVGVRHGRGAWVQPESEWNLMDRDVIAAFARSQDRQELLTEVLECRRIIEPEAAALAAKRAEPEQLPALDEAFARLKAANATRRARLPERDALVAAEVGFHEALVRLTANRALMRVLSSVHIALAIARHERVEERSPALVRTHDRVRKAVNARDPEQAREAVLAGVRQLAGWLR